MQRYAKFFSTIPHLTEFYRIFPHPTLTYRILPIGVSFSARRAEKERMGCSKGADNGGRDGDDGGVEFRCC